VFIGEWSAVRFSSAALLQAFSWRDPGSADWWLLAAAAIVILAALYIGEFGQAIVLAVGAYAALEHIRFQGLFAILVCIVGGGVLARAWKGKLGASTRAVHGSSSIATEKVAAWGLVAAVGLLGLVRIADLATDRYYLQSDQIVFTGLGPSWWFPEEAAQFLIENRLPGNVFSDYNLGGYLTWQLGPAYPDYFDGRFLPFGEGLFLRQRELVATPLDSPEWRREADARGIQTAIFSVARVAGLENVPLALDCQSHDWTPVYLDDVAAIFVRNSAETADVVRRLGIQCISARITESRAAGVGGWRGRAERFQFLANSASIYYVLQRDADAAAAIANAESIFADDPNLHLLKAQLAEAHGQAAIAEQEYRASLQIRPSDAAWYALAGLYAAQHEYQEALPCLLQSLALSQASYDRYRALGKLYLAMNQPQKALGAFEEAASRDPIPESAGSSENDFRDRVAEGEAAAYHALGDLGRAETAQSEAVRLTPDNPTRWQALAQIYRDAGQQGNAAQAERTANSLFQKANSKEAQGDLANGRISQ
jgi:tetratricopeptide (TPR) repeat protein